MIKIPNYNVQVPVTDDFRFTTKTRNDDSGDRGANIFTDTLTDASSLELPFIPQSRDWVEIYIDSVRLINPTSTSTLVDPTFTTYEIVGNTVNFVQPITGNITVISDIQPTHWWGALIIKPDNLQVTAVFKDLYDFTFNDWPVRGGTARGARYKINYKPGPDFTNGSYVIVQGCQPTFFNGNFQVVNSTKGTVTVQGPAPRVGTMKKSGIISGIGSGTVIATEGISLYSEPIIITQPYNGYVRLTTDRKSLAYVPNLGYSGNDAFSWSLINQHGQIANPKCVSIKVMAS